MNLITAENLSISFGEKTIFSDVSFGIEEGQKVAIVGRNGCGKTTLMKIICGLEKSETGKITMKKDLKIRYLEQEPQFEENDTALSAALRCLGDEGLAAAKYEEAVANGKSEDELVWLREECDRLGAWDAEVRVRAMLGKMGIEDSDKKVSTMSGGQKKRTAIACTLLSDADLLVLDEPTNHLDLGLVEWIEEKLIADKRAILMVTHDRYFLDRVCSRILEIANEQMYAYDGNYQYYIEKKSEREDLEIRTAQHLRNTFRRELDWMRRQPQARGGKSKSRKDRFYEIEERLKVRQTNDKIEVSKGGGYIGNKIIELKYISKSYDDKVLFKDFFYTFARGEKIGITGVNGSGKTTLLKMILGEVKPDSGDITIGETVRFGYYSQSGMEIKENQKVIDCIRETAETFISPDGTKIDARALLTRFLFDPPRQQDYVYKLSGGERKRLQLCKILAQSPNFLIMDEPTNDLDTQTIATLEEYLYEFKGCVLVVSHDRCFMDRIADHIFAIEKDGHITDFPGSYSDYRLWKDEKDKEEQQQTQKKQTIDSVPEERKRQRAVKATFKEKKLFEETEKRLGEIDNELKEIESKLCSGNETGSELEKLSRKHKELSDEKDELEMIWLELSEKM